jgi:hypothetical protein
MGGGSEVRGFLTPSRIIPIPTFSLGVKELLSVFICG